MDFLFDIKQHRARIRNGLRDAGHYRDADEIYLGLREARPVLIHTGEGLEAVVYNVQGYSIVATDMTGCQIPLKDDWMIAIYTGDITGEASEVLLLDCGR